MVVAPAWLLMSCLFAMLKAQEGCNSELRMKGVSKITFGKRLRELRRAKSISQLELSEKIGVSRQTLSKWENDAVLPDVPNVIALADFFQVTTDYLLRGEYLKQESCSNNMPTIMNQICEWVRNRDNWLYIFIAVYVLFLILMWSMFVGPPPKKFPIG